MATRIPVRFRKISILLHHSFRTCQISISHQKQVALSLLSHIRRKIRRKNITHAKAKKTGSAKLRSKFENLRREIKSDIRKQHDLYVNNLEGDVKANPRDFIGISIVRGDILKAFPL